jgi:hypothetical protein
VPRTARVEEGGVEVEEREVGCGSSHLEEVVSHHT